MAKLRINEDETIEGLVTVTRSLIEIDGERRLLIEGMLKTSEYIEEIFQIETPRFSIINVDVTQESFGSEEDEIIYAFTAERLTVEQ